MLKTWRYIDCNLKLKSITEPTYLKKDSFWRALTDWEMLLQKKVKRLFHFDFLRQVTKRLRELKFPQMCSREPFLIDCCRMVRCGSARENICDK